MKTLLLFDIDGTLVDTRGAGPLAMMQAFDDAFGIAGSDAPKIDFNGAVDNGIVLKYFPSIGLEPSEANREKFYAAYLTNLEAELLPGAGEPLPGAAALLSFLDQEHGDVFLSQLTGNIQRGAEIKLDHVGLNHFLKGGAFGDDHHNRNALGPIAVKRARHLAGVEFEATRVVIIGDTPKDIECGRAIGARTIGVATGNFTETQLSEAGASAVVNSLEELLESPKLLVE